MHTVIVKQTSCGYTSMPNSHAYQRYQRLPSQQSIRIFEAAARHLSFTQAGLELAITQSGVSKQVKGLESFLGVSLFIRDGHQLLLTEAGKVFYSRCSQALDQLQQAVNEVQGEAGRVRLQAPPTFAARWLIPRMDKLRQQYPQLELQLETTWLRTINDRIQAEGNELVIHVCRDYPFDDLHVQPLRRETLCVLVSPDYLSQHRQISGPSDLIGKSLIHTRLDGHIHWQAWCQAMHFNQLDTSQGYEFETLDMAVSAAENAIGVVVCDLIYALDALESGRLVVPFKMPVMRGLRYLLLRQPGHRFKGLQDNYISWLTEQITLDEQRINAVVDHLGLTTDLSIDAFTEELRT